MTCDESKQIIITAPSSGKEVFHYRADLRDSSGTIYTSCDLDIAQGGSAAVLTIPLVETDLYLNINDWWASEELRFYKDQRMEVLRYVGIKEESQCISVTWTARAYVENKYTESRSSQPQMYNAKLESYFLGVTDSKYLKLKVDCSDCIADMKSIGPRWPWVDDQGWRGATCTGGTLPDFCQISQKTFKGTNIEPIEINSQLNGYWGFDNYTFISYWTNQTVDGEIKAEGYVVFEVTLEDSKNYQGWERRKITLLDFYNFWGNYYSTSIDGSFWIRSINYKNLDTTVIPCFSYLPGVVCNSVIPPILIYSIYVNGQELVKSGTFAAPDQVPELDFDNITKPADSFRTLTATLTFTNNADVSQDVTKTHTIKINNPPLPAFKPAPRRPVFKKYINNEWKKLLYGNKSEDTTES